MKIAARHLNERGGVLLGDVVGLGKTMMASALMRIFRDDFNLRPLIICPKNLESMWEQYNNDWDLGAEIIPFSVVTQRIPTLPPRYKLIVIDESHTLRNREGQRYKAIYDYIHAFGEKECKVVLLSATPYNKSYLDLGAQLRLFISEERDLGIRPEIFIRDGGEAQLLQAQIQPRTLRAFEASPHADDWRDLMRLFMVRRTRSFIKQHYAKFDNHVGRSYLAFPDNSRFYFPDRVPRTVAIRSDLDGDPYRALYDAPVVDTIGRLSLPRYGLANYLKRDAERLATPAEKPVLQNLSRAGKRLMGFCRTNLFKRLESGGFIFLQSLDRHILRNYIFLHAIANKLPLPVGTQGAELLGADSDLDLDSSIVAQQRLDEDSTNETDAEAAEGENSAGTVTSVSKFSKASYQQRAATVYTQYTGPLKGRFKWVRSDLFAPKLRSNSHFGSTCLIAVCVL